MNKKEIFGWLMDIALAWIVLLILVLMSKLTYDFLSTPNIFKKETTLTQKQSDEMCAAWWFDSDLESAKKRICKK